MLARTLYIICILLLPLTVMAQRQLVVVNVESRVPIRDVIVTADNGSKFRTPWDGVIEWPDSVNRLDFRHPDFESRYVLKPEVKGDTIFLIPNIHALREVVILGERRFDKRMSSMMYISPEKKLTMDLERIQVPAGISPVGLALWIYDKTMRKSVEARKHRKKALKVVRQQEAAYQEQWDALEGKK